MERQTSLSSRHVALVATHEWHPACGLAAPLDAAVKNCCPALGCSTAAFPISMVQQSWRLRLLCPVRLHGSRPSSQRMTQLSWHLHPMIASAEHAAQVCGAPQLQVPVRLRGPPQRSGGLPIQRREVKAGAHAGQLASVCSRLIKWRCHTTTNYT